MRSINRLRAVSVLALLILAAGALVPVAWSDEPETIVRVTARKFEYSPNEIRLKRGVPAIIELTSLDRLHGFDCPGLGLRTDIPPGKTTRLRVVPDKSGTFPFHCDVFCGEGHEDMTGTIIVTD
ncbi:MAG TPA: cupredoxin domain-containing protein [Candidatus Deferrimicrobiaceae bacterium]|jgi:cytochrome c oxidase subunit 2